MSDTPTNEQLRAIWLSGFKSGACTVFATATKADAEDIERMGQMFSSAAAQGEGAASIDRQVREILAGENLHEVRIREVELGEGL